MNPGQIIFDGSLILAIGISIAAGLISFLSPCVLPLVPGYLGVLSGMTEGEDDPALRGGATGTDATFDGGYVEAGLFLTEGDTMGYRNGNFDRVRPHRSLADGGPGAIQFNVRYDTLDLTDGAIRGGTQDGYSASLVWTPTDYTRFILNYGHMDYANAFIALPGGDRSYSADAVGVRGQFDF